MNRMIIVGSPRVNGRCATLADELFEACIEDYPDDLVSLIPLSSVEVEPCVGCNACRSSEDNECPIDDDMAEIREVLDDCDELILVCPVYFAGAPATMKAFLDRLQPYFWTDARRGQLRPATLHIVGEGHDPFGFGALITTVQSACYTAGFRLEIAMNWVGRRSETGENEEEPEVIEVAWPDGVAAAADEDPEE